MTKLGMWTNLDAPSLRHAMELENRTQVLGTFTRNMTEAGRAFVEKRDPTWNPPIVLAPLRVTHTAPEWRMVR